MFHLKLSSIIGFDLWSIIERRSYSSTYKLFELTYTKQIRKFNNVIYKLQTTLPQHSHQCNSEIFIHGHSSPLSTLNDFSISLWTQPRSTYVSSQMLLSQSTFRSLSPKIPPESSHSMCGSSYSSHLSFSQSTSLSSSSYSHSKFTPSHSTSTSYYSMVSTPTHNITPISIWSPSLGHISSSNLVHITPATSIESSNQSPRMKPKLSKNQSYAFLAFNDSLENPNFPSVNNF